MRVFLAIPLAEKFSENVQNYLNSGLREIAAVRWAKPEQVHLTLHFFGEVSGNQIPIIIECAESAVFRHSGIELGLENLSCFPNYRTPRVIWLGINGDIDRLFKLQKDLERELLQKDFPAEERVFKPHATIGRVKEGAAILWDELEAFKQFKAQPEYFEYLCLFQSVSSSSGPRYEILKKISFPKK